MLVFHSRCNYQLEKIMISADDGYLRSFQRISYCVALSFGIFSAIIINLEDNILQYINPIDICREKILNEILIWIFPKITSHCDLIRTNQNIYSGIGIIWDFWIFVVCICSLSLGFYFFLAMYNRKKSEVYEFVFEHRAFFIFVFSISILVFGGLFYYVFFNLPLVDGKIPLSWMFIKEDQYGIHAAAEGWAISMISFKGFSRALFIFMAIK